MALASVVVTPAQKRPFYEPSPDVARDVFYVLTLGPPFCYPIPSFDVLSVKLRQARIFGATPEGQEHYYDVFIREDPSLSHSLPTWLTVIDAAVVDVSSKRSR